MQRESADRGKWSQEGVPHKGWTCVSVEDYEYDLIICEMCEFAKVRYVHIMEHPDYEDQLRVGCVCAGHMEEDYDAPRNREKLLKSRARKKITLFNKEWKLSQKGNYYRKDQGYMTHVGKGDRGWWSLVVSPNGTSEYAGQSCATMESAALCCFDLISRKLSQLRVFRSGDDLF